MHRKLQNLRLLKRRQILAVLAIVLILCATLAGLVDNHKARALTSSTFNFQARLMSNAGNIVPDGFYNVEFKLYDVSSGGSALWTETYYDSNGGTAGNDNRTRVANGYLTVSLGSLTSFPGTINWDQDLWLTMNVGGSTQTATPTWDGEMSPRLKLTAVPYAFRAGQLAKLTGSDTSVLDFDTQTDSRTILLPDEDGILCIQGSSDCGFIVGAGSAFLHNGNSFGATAVLGTNDNFGLNFEINTNVVGSFSTNGALLLQNAANSTTAFNIKNASPTSGNLFTVDTSNSRVGVALGGNNTPTLTNQGLEVNGAIRISGSALDTYTTPGSSGVGARLSVVNADLNAGSQVIAVGVTAASNVASRGITVADARTVAHQPSIAVLSPNENEIGGLSWEGSNDDLYVKSSGANIRLQPNDVDSAVFSDTAITLRQDTALIADQNLTLQNGAGVFAQTYASSSASSAQTLSVTNGNSGGSSIAVNGHQITLVGTATSGGINSNTAISFANPSAATNNNFYGLNFAGTGYTDILRVNGTQIINGSGIVQSAGISGSYTGITGVGTLTAGALGAGFTTVAVGQGGTGATTFTSNGVLYGNGTGAIQATAAGTTGQCLLGNTSAAPSWGACATGTVTLQTAYNASTDPELTLGSAATAGITIRDNSTPISGNLLEVQNNAGSATYLGVTTSGISVTGNVDAGTGTIIGSNFRSTDQTAGSTSSAATTFRSGNVSGATSNSGVVTLQSGNSSTSGNTGNVSIVSGNAASGNSGNISLDVGTATGTLGQISLGTTTATTVNIGAIGSTNKASTIHIADTTNATAAQAVTIGSTAANASNLTIIQGGSNTTQSIQLLPNTAGGVMIGASAGTGTITVGQSTASNTISIGSANLTSGTPTQNINIGNGSFSTGATVAVNILSGTAGSSGTATLSLGNNDRVTQIDIGNVAADAARTLNFGTGSNIVGVDTINIGTGNTTVAGGKTIHIGDGTPSGSGTNLITIGTAATAGSTVTLQGVVKLSNPGSATANAVALCRDSSTTNLIACDSGVGGTPFIQGGNSFSATGVLGTNDANNLQFETNNVVRATFDQSNGLYLGNGVTAAAPNNFTVAGTGSSTAGTAGANLTLQGGAGASATTGSAGGNVLIAGGNAGGSGNNAGGNVTLQGGLDSNTGIPGKVLVKNSADSVTAFQVQNTAGSSTIFDVDTLNGRVGVGTAAPLRTVDVSIDTTSVNSLPLLLQQAGTGDVGLEISTGVESYYLGIDNSDNDKFKISSGSGSGSVSVMGNNTTGTNTDSGNANALHATKFTAANSGTVTKLFAYVASPVSSSPNDQAQMAIYSDNSGVPDQLIVSSGSTTLTADAWNEFTVAPTSLTGSTVYWLAYNTNGGTAGHNNLRYTTPGSADQSVFDATHTYGTWPAPWTTVDGTPDVAYSLYAQITGGGGTNNFSVALFELSSTGQALFKNSTDSTTAFRVQNAAGTNQISLDTGSASEVLGLGINGSDAQAGTVNIGTSTGAIQNVTVGAAGANNSVTIIQGGNSNTTGSEAIRIIPETAGGILIGGSAGTGTITLGRSTATNIINIGNGTTATGNVQTVNIATSGTGTGRAAITVGNTNGASTLVLQAGTGTATGDINIGDQTTASKIVDIGSVDNAGTGTVRIATGAAVQTVTMGSTNSTSTTAIQGGTGTAAGDINIGDQTTAGKIVDIGSVTNAGTGTVRIATGAAVQTVTMGSTNSTSTTTIQGGTGTAAGDINIGDQTTAGKIIDIGSVTNAGTGTVRIATGAAVQTVTVGSTNGASTLTLQGGTGTATGDINIGDQTTASKIIHIGSVDNAGTGTVRIATGAAVQDVMIGSTNSTSTTRLQAGTNDLIFDVAGTVRATIDENNFMYLGNGITAATPNAFTLSGTGSTTTAVAGGAMTLQGGNATVGNANGGNVTITGGTGFGTGVLGLVRLAPTTFFSSGSTQTFNGSSGCPVCNITGVDSFSSIAIDADVTGLSINVPVPNASNQTIGRILYVTAVAGSEDFTIVLGGTSISIGMKANSTATLIWNGTGWTAAGASSSTDLQSAYNNTQASAGAAELVLNPSGGAADGLTVRNNATTPIIGALLEVQTSIGSNLLSVNNNATEYATNGGAETAGGTSSTFPSNTWDTTTGGTVDRWTTAGDNIATGQASVRVQTTTTNHGARNRISASLTSGLTYNVSFAVRGATNFSTLQVLYSPDGTTTGTTQCATAQVVTTGIWTRITCSFVASGTITSSNSILIRQTDATARTFYIDNLSVNINASATFAADGSVDNAGAFATNWTDFDGGTGSTTITRETTVIYDTSASTAGATTANANQGIRNNMPITPSLNTQYLVTFYARSTSTMTGSLSVGFLPTGGTTPPSGSAACTDYSTQSLVANTWTKITCLFTTTGTTITDADLVIFQTDATARTIYVDALSITLNTNNSSNVQVGGANKGGPTTLFTLDRASTAPIAANNEAYLGSMYYDTTSGRIQCYEADGWGACGAAPDNIVNLNPEYAGAVLNGTGIGTMTADFCSNDAALTVNNTLCSTGQAKNFYRWTSPQATQQTYSVYVTYQLPATFNGFASDDTVQLVARVDNTTNASVTYEMFKSTGSAVTQCGSSETNVITGGGGSANTWYSYGINGNESTGCSFNSSSAGNFVIFKINLKANSNANAYVSTLSFTTTGR